MTNVPLWDQPNSLGYQVSKDEAKATAGKEWDGNAGSCRTASGFISREVYIGYRANILTGARQPAAKREAK